MRRLSTVAPLGALILAAAPAWYAASAAGSDEQKFSQIERGRYFATLADCTACHTAKRWREAFCRRAAD